MRFSFLLSALALSALAWGAGRSPSVALAAGSRTAATGIRVALVQFDARPGEVRKNLNAMERLARQAVANGARLVLFHELATTDYMDDMTQLAEPIPEGPSCRRMESLAKELDCFLSFGMPEQDGGRLYIAQVFFGPQGFVYRYRKTWLCKDETDGGYRNEWARYNPGTGPELFEIDGIRATCFICADATAPRCIEQARALRPELVFFPVNRGARKFQEYPALIARIGAPTLVANRVGKSYGRDCVGGSAVYGGDGQILAQANRDHQEEILYYQIALPANVKR